MKSTLLFLLLLVVPLVLLPGPQGASVPAGGPNDLVCLLRAKPTWGTVLIWTEKKNGRSLMTGIFLDREKRLVLAPRHSIEEMKDEGKQPVLADKFYIVWPLASSDGLNVEQLSDSYFRHMRAGRIHPARVVREDPARDLVLLEAGDPPPSQAVPIKLNLAPVESQSELLGVGQPFTRSHLWQEFRFTAKQTLARPLSYVANGQPVNLIQGEIEPSVEFGFSGSPLVHPQDGTLAGMVLAGQVNQPKSAVVITSREILKLLTIE